MPIPLINFDLYKIIVKELRYTAPNNEVAFIMHILDKLP